MPNNVSKTVHISHYDYGDRSLPTLILIMGLGMPAAAWPIRFIRQLVRKGLHVVTLDNRDSGQSEIFEEEISSLKVMGAIARYVAGGSVTAPYQLEDMATDVERVMDELGIARAHVAGISMGGMIAQVLATIAPHRVTTLTCLSSATGNPRTGLGKLSAIKAILMPPGNVESDEGLREHYRNTMKAIGTRDCEYDNEDIDRLIAVLRKHPVPVQATERQLLAILASGDRRHQLRQLSVPTLVIHGKEDPLLPIIAGREIMASIPGAHMLEIDRMGHDLPDFAVDQVAEAIAAHCYGAAIR